ncbi:MAG: acyl-CoA carboxylase subunit beta, partial [Deinococcus sp.]|nr:acyl-CoA carboxylase subunit beta [Deinococcus sp.]
PSWRQRFIYAWPSAKYAVMSGASAAKTLLEIEISKLERDGKVPTAEDQKELYDRIKGRYEETLDPRYAAGRLWVDEIIYPHQTRERLIRALEACALNPDREELKVGVFQV